jgi:hypothetical protein
MRTIEANGAKITIPGRCDCGETCSDEVAADHVHDWNKSGRKCAFCGEIIRVISFTMKHYHKLGNEAARWSSDSWPGYEDHWEWLDSGLHGRVNIRVHVSCAKDAMPYANFERFTYSSDRPEVIADNEMPKEISRGPCLMCGIVPSDEDVRQVAARVFNFFGPCVYCGKRIKLRSLTLFHGSLTGEHTGRWHFEDYDREPTLSFSGYRFDVKEYTRLEFVGHLMCATKAMPHAEWLEVNKAFWNEEVRIKVKRGGWPSPLDWSPRGLLPGELPRFAT